MKKVMVILGSVVLAGFTPVDKVGPVLEQPEKKITHSSSAAAPTCPFYAPSSSGSVDAGDAPLYVHCSKCQQGVMTEHTDGETKYTFCGEKN